MEKVTGYITWRRAGVAQLLVFRDPGHAAFGLVVACGTVEENERLEDALLRDVRGVGVRVGPWVGLPRRSRICGSRGNGGDPTLLSLRG